VSTNPSAVSVDLVKFRGEYFCLDEASYHILRDHQVTVFRIKAQTLDLLRSTLLKKVKINVHPWSNVWPQMRDRFLSKLPKEGIETNCDGNSILIGISKMLDPEEIQGADRYIQMRISQMQELIGRYGIRTVIKTKENTGYKMFKLLFVPDESIMPSFYFGLSPKSPVTKYFYLSPTCRVEFTRKQSASGDNLIHLAFEDKLGDNWSQTVVRSFPIKNLKPSSIEEMLSFFILLHQGT
jgi:hypothetical protein